MPRWHHRQRGGIGVPHLQRGAAADALMGSGRVVVDDEGGEQLHQRLQPQQRPVLDELPVPSPGTVHESGQRGQKQLLDAFVGALHGALQMRGVRPQRTGVDRQRRRRQTHRGGQELLAPVEADRDRDTAHRAIGCLDVDRGAQRAEHRFLARGHRQRPAQDHSCVITALPSGATAAESRPTDRKPSTQA